MTMSVESIAVELAQQVKQMHGNPANAKQLTQALEKFQLSQQSLQVVALLLMQGTEPETVLHFAAQTVVLKVQSGTLAVSSELEASLFALVAKYGAVSQTSAVLRTLTVAYVDYVLMFYSTFGQGLMTRISSLPPTAQLCLLVVLPDEARNSRVFVRGSLRGQLTNALVTDHAEAALAIIQNCGSSLDALNAMKTWLRAMRFEETIRRSRSLGERYSCTLNSKVFNHPLFKNVLQGFHSASTSVAAAEICGSVLSEALLLSSDTRADLEIVLAVAESAAALASALRGALPVGTENFIFEKSRADWDLIQRSKLACRLLSEISATHFFGLVVSLETAPAEVRERLVNVLTATMESALYFVGVRHLEISSVALDFFYNLLTAYLGANELADEDDDLFADDLAGSTVGISRFLSRRMWNDASQAAALVLRPYFERLLPTLLVALCYPGDPDADDAFDAETFVQFRETCANVLSDSCAILDAQWVIERIGETLDGCCTAEADGSVTAPWQRIEACIHVLTAVAPKAEAGKDRVIPMVLNLLPRLKYPTQGTSGLLLRAAAGRILTYTGGYVRDHMELCMQLLSFFSTKLIPSLSSLPWQRQSGEMDLVAFAQNSTCQALRSVLGSSKYRLAELPAQEFGALFQALVSLVADERLGLEARTLVVSGLGLMLAELRDWNQVRLGLKDLSGRVAVTARRLAETFQPPQNPNANGPAGIKIYLATLQAIGQLPTHGSMRSGAIHYEDDSSGGSNESSLALGDIPNHPVLANMEDQWPLVEHICRTFACAYEDVAAQTCSTFVHIFSHSRSYAAGSPILLRVLGTAAACFIQRPSSHWMHLAKAFVTQFGELTRVHVALVQTLSELSETFVKHATNLMTRNTSMRALTFDEAKMVADTFAVLSEVLRYVDLVSNVVRHQHWLRPTVAVAVACVSDAEIDAQTLPGIAGLLHFCERLMTWIDPPLIMHAAEDTEQVAKETASIVKSLLVEPTGGPAGELVVDKLVTALCHIWAVKAAEYPQVLPSVATSLRLGLVSSLSPIIGARLRSIAEREWTQLLPSQKLTEVFSQFEATCRNSRAFGKVVQDLAKDFSVERKRQLHKQSIAA